MSAGSIAYTEDTAAPTAPSEGAIEGAAQQRLADQARTQPAMPDQQDLEYQAADRTGYGTQAQQADQAVETEQQARDVAADLRAAARSEAESRAWSAADERAPVDPSVVQSDAATASEAYADPRAAAEPRAREAADDKVSDEVEVHAGVEVSPEDPDIRSP